MNDFFFLLDYQRTTAGRRCHCGLVPSVLFTERSETSKERESTLMSVRIGKEETESHLLSWSTQAGSLGRIRGPLKTKSGREERLLARGCGALVRLGWSSWHEELGFDKRIKTIAVRLNRQRKRDPTDRPPNKTT